MSKDHNANIREILFKPIIVKTEIEERFVFIYAYNCVIEHVLSNDGQINKNHKDIVKFIDIQKSIAMNTTIIDEMTVTDRKKFRSDIVEIPISQCFQDIIHATSVVIEETAEISQRMTEMQNILSAIKKCSSELKYSVSPSHGNIVLAGSEEPLAHIVFKTITGENVDITKNLSQDDIILLGQVLLEIIHLHMEDDLENEDFLKKLKAEIEYKIVESLPSTLRAGDIHINLEAFVEEIKRFRDTEQSE